MTLFGKNCKKSSVKRSIEKPVLLKFVNLSPTFCSKLMDSESELLCILAAVIIQRKKTTKKKRKHRVKVQSSDWVTSQNFNVKVTYHKSKD